MLKIKRIIKILIGRDLYYQPQINCSFEKYGNDYGGWNVHTGSINKGSIIYSFGVGTDISFDLALINKFNCNVYAFDPTPRSLKWINSLTVPKNFKYFPLGINDFDGQMTLFEPIDPTHASFSINQQKHLSKKTIEVPVQKISTIMNNQGHRTIDLLKMDIEGCEYQVVEDLLTSSLNIKQLLIEFHHRFSRKVVKKTKKVISLLNNHGYKIFAISDNGEEYSFLKN